MSNLDIEFFVERAMLASKDRDSADWRSLMKDLMAPDRRLASWRAVNRGSAIGLGSSSDLETMERRSNLQDPIEFRLRQS